MVKDWKWQRSTYKKILDHKSLILQLDYKVQINQSNNVSENKQQTKTRPEKERANTIRLNIKQDKNA